MRYEVRQFDYGWCTFDTLLNREFIAFAPYDHEPLTEAEASVIAFALNAVAGGYCLLSAVSEIPHSDDSTRLDEHAIIQEYTGPTEGID